MSHRYQNHTPLEKLDQALQTISLCQELPLRDKARLLLAIVKMKKESEVAPRACVKQD